MTDKDRREITQLRGGGMGYGRISRQLCIPLSTVKSYCIRNNVPSKARGRYACSVDMRLSLGRPVRERDFALMVAG